MAKAIVERGPSTPGPVIGIELQLSVEEARYLFRLIGRQNYTAAGPQYAIYKQLDQIKEVHA